MEKKLEKKLKFKVEKRGGLCLKFVSPGRSGVPDRIVLFEGKTWFVELKTKNGRLTALQLATHRALEIRGARVRVVNSLETLNNFISEIFTA